MGGIKSTLQSLLKGVVKIAKFIKTFLLESRRSLAGSVLAY